MNIRVFAYTLIILTLFASASVADTETPVISSVVLSHPVAAKGDSLKVTATVTDNVGVTEVQANGVEMVNTSGFDWEGDISADPTNGFHTVTVIAYDAAGNSSVDTSTGYTTRPVYGIRSTSALESVVSDTTATQDNLYRVWGSATVLTPNSFSLNDGTIFPTRVIFEGHDVCNGDFVVAHGILDPSAPPATISSSRYSILIPASRTPINLGDVNLGKNLQATMSGTIPTAAPAGNLIVTLTSMDPSKVLLSTSATAPGVAQITRRVNAGSVQIPSFYIHALDSSGTAGVLATAPGCLGKTINVNLLPSGFAFMSSGNLTTTTFSNPSTISVRPFQLNPANLSTISSRQIRGGLTVDLPIYNSDDSVGTLTTNTVTYTGGGSLEGAPSLRFIPESEGSSVVSLGTPVGFSSPSNNQQRTVIVTAPGVSMNNVSVGEKLTTTASFALLQAPPEPVDVLLTSQDPSKLLLAVNLNDPGSASIILSGMSSLASRTYYLQGMEQGTAVVTASTPGYQNGQATMTIGPSAFVFHAPTVINTTTFSANTTLDVRPYLLNTSNSPVSAQRLRPGLSAMVSLSLSNPDIGELTQTTLNFSGGDMSLTSQFDPSDGGTGSIMLEQPEGFTIPTSRVEIPVTVSAPNINATSSVTVGKNLQTGTSIALQQAPPEPVTVTVTVNDPDTAKVARTTQEPGSDTLTITTSSSSVGSVYIQGFEQGSTTISITAPGYNSASINVTVNPSGFVFTSAGTTTTYYSSGTNINIRSGQLNPNFALSSYQSVRPGLNPTPTLTLTGDPVGTLSSDSVEFSAGDNNKNVVFSPNAVGTTVVSINQPAGFSVPSNMQTYTITVTAPTINFDDFTTGRNLQSSRNPILTAVPPNPVDITLTSSDPGTFLLSKSSTEAGTGSIEFEEVSTATVGTVWIQGVSLGTANLTISAPGIFRRLQPSQSIHPGLWCLLQL